MTKSKDINYVRINQKTSPCMHKVFELVLFLPFTCTISGATFGCQVKQLILWTLNPEYQAREQILGRVYDTARVQNPNFQLFEVDALTPNS